LKLSIYFCSDKTHSFSLGMGVLLVDPGPVSAAKTKIGAPAKFCQPHPTCRFIGLSVKAWPMSACGKSRPWRNNLWQKSVEKFLFTRTPIVWWRKNDFIGREREREREWVTERQLRQYTYYLAAAAASTCLMMTTINQNLTLWICYVISGWAFSSQNVLWQCYDR